MKIYKLVLLFCALAMISCGQTKEFQNNTYEKVDGEWYLISEGGDRFQVVQNVITLKYASDVTPEQIAGFETQNGLSLVRKAKTGWHDYEVTSNADVFKLSAQLLKSPLVSKLEIPTGGAYQEGTNNGK